MVEKDTFLKEWKYHTFKELMDKITRLQRSSGKETRQIRMKTAKCFIDLILKLDYLDEVEGKQTHTLR